MHKLISNLYYHISLKKFFQQNLEKAYSYYKMAADKDYVKAIVKLASWYKTGKFLPQDINESIKLYTKAAEHNDIEAIENLINIYELGI